MSFLLDPPLLVAAGAAIDALAPDRRTGDILAAGTVAGFYAVSVPLWRDHDARVLDLFWRPFGSDGPRDFMVNSGVLDLPVPRRPSAGQHLAAATALATYPAFLWLGRRLAGQRRRRAGLPATSVSEGSR